MHLCQNCVRYNPGAVSNCIKAKDVVLLSNRYSIRLAVIECHEYLPEVVNGEEELEENDT